MAIKVSLSVSLKSVVSSGSGRVRVSFDYETKSWADAVLSVSSSEATVVECEPSAVAKGRHSDRGHVELSERSQSSVGLTFRLEVPGGGGMAIVVKHANTGAT